MNTPLRNCIIKIGRSPELVADMAAQTWDYGDERARKKAYNLRKEFNAKVLLEIIVFSNKVGMHSHIDFTKAVVQATHIIVPASNDFVTTLRKKCIPYILECNLL